MEHGARPRSKCAWPFSARRPSGARSCWRTRRPIGRSRLPEEEAMLTAEANERLSRVGPGTPMGNLLRRYWHPVAATSELAKEAVLAVRLLGEDLALYRT